MFNSAREKGSNSETEDIRQRMMRVKSLRNSGRKSNDSTGPQTPVGTPTKSGSLPQQQINTSEKKPEELKAEIIQQLTLPQILTDEKRREVFKQFSEKEK